MNTHAVQHSHPVFTVQKHKATRLHYDFRLEIDGVLKSWAIPRGPSLDPKVKRLAVAVDDHRLDYANFEGVIEDGRVLVWDLGWYRALDGEGSSHQVQRHLQEGKLDFVLHGRRLKGAFSLIRVKGRAGHWLLIKHRDAESRPGLEVTTRYETSVLTGRTLDHLEKNARASFLRTVHCS